MLEAFDGFIAAVASETGWVIHKRDDRAYQANVEFEGGRHQNVLISVDRDEVDDPVIDYWSQICPLDKPHKETLLKILQLNAELTYASLAVYENKLILRHTIWFPGLDPQRFIKSLAYIAAKADEIEELLISVDAS